MKTTIILGVLLVPAIYYDVQQRRENAVLGNIVSELHSDLTPWQAAKELSREMRAQFETDKSRFNHLDLADRPFLREPAEYLLDIGEGVCGEGTRVLVNLLIAAGYDATRVTLYDSRLDASHTLVSLVDGDEEYFVDSLNTSDAMNAFIESNQVNAESFRIVKYDDNVVTRNEMASMVRQREDPFESDSEAERFFDKYLYYSYEATPWTKVFSTLGMDTRILNFDRPPQFVSSLAEKPYRIMSIVWAAFAVLASGLIAIVRRSRL